MSAVLTEFRTRTTSETRKPVMTLVEVSWEDQQRILQRVSACMEDKSSGGACIRFKTPISVGSKLEIQWRHERFSGTARYCRAEGREYLVGIQRETTTRPIVDRRTPAAPAQKDPPQKDNLPQKIVRSGDLLVSTAPVSTVPISTPKDQSPQKQQQIKPNKVPVFKGTFDPRSDQLFEDKVNNNPIVPTASPTATPVRRIGAEIDEMKSARLLPRNLDSHLQAEHLTELRTKLLTDLLGELRNEIRNEIQTKQPPKQAGEGRKPMQNKWLELPWPKKQEGLGASDAGSGHASSDSNSKSNGKSEKEKLMPDLTQSTPKAAVRSAREVPSFQVDLSPMEDIYRAAGIMNPKRGYSINKVVEMLQSRHIRDLSKEMKRAAVLMALEAAGTSIDQVQRDAKVRQDALDAHEAQQKEQVEGEWARKAEEVIQIQAELESIKAHYMSRIERNKEGVARERATFADWLATKHEESLSMAEAIELCLKGPVSEPASASASEVSMVKASAKTV